MCFALFQYLFYLPGAHATLYFKMALACLSLFIICSFHLNTEALEISYAVKLVCV